MVEFKRSNAGIPLVIIMESCIYGNLSGGECHKPTYSKRSRLKFIHDLANNQHEIIFWRSGLSMINVMPRFATTMNILC